MSKIIRAGVSYSIAWRGNEWRLLLGNKIVSRHKTEEAAMQAYYAATKQVKA